MTVALAMIVKDEAQRLPAAIGSAQALVDEVWVVDTGSTDGTPEIAKELGAHVASIPWQGFGHARTAALRIARKNEWTLMIDADMTIEAHHGLKAWLETDPDPDVTAWQVQVVDGTIDYRLPLLTRGHLDWQYDGWTHEYLRPIGKQRPLTGLKLHHFPSPNRTAKHERDLELLAEGVVTEDPRSVYYTAQALWCLGRIPAAVEMYELRATLGGWEEEKWHAEYMAARLREDVDGLMMAWTKRPYRHEPLTHAARIVNKLPNDDLLFLERAGADAMMSPW